MGEDLVAAGLTESQLAKVNLIVLATNETATSRLAKVVLAGLHTFEKSGTLINQQFRLQVFHQAVPGPSGTVDDLVLLGTLLAQQTGDRAASTAAGVWKELSQAVPQFSGLTFARIPETGHPLDGSAFAHLSFVEEESLHFKPASLAPA